MNNDDIEELRRKTNIVSQIDKIEKINKDRQFKETIQKNQRSKDKSEFDYEIDAAKERLKQKGTPSEQWAYIMSQQFNIDHNLEEIDENITKRR